MKKALKTALVLGLLAGGWTVVHAGLAAPQGQNKPLSQQKGGQQGGQAGSQPTPEEQQAFTAIQNELDPDRKVQMIADFEKKYPNSSGLAYVYVMAAGSYQQKGDVPKVLEYGEKSLKLNGDNLGALLLMSSTLPEPQALQGNDLAKEKKLTEAEDYANRAIKLVEQLPKQPNETDEQLQKRRAGASSWAHSSLGMVHLQRSTTGLAGPDTDELAKAQKEYQTAISMTDSPNPGDYFRLGEALQSSGKLDEAIDAFTKAGEADPSGMIKASADKQIEVLKSKKAGAKPPEKH